MLNRFSPILKSAAALGATRRFIFSLPISNLSRVPAMRATPARLAVRKYTSTEPAPSQMTPRVQNLIKKALDTHDIVIYMKGTPGYPKCGFSRMVVQIMDLTGVKYHAVDILEDEELRQGIKEFSSWPTIPQVYIKGEFVGGADIMRTMYESGDLKDLLTQHKILEKDEMPGATH